MGRLSKEGKSKGADKKQKGEWNKLKCGQYNFIWFIIPEDGASKCEFCDSPAPPSQKMWAILLPETSFPLKREASPSLVQQVNKTPSLGQTWIDGVIPAGSEWSQASSWGQARPAGL